MHISAGLDFGVAQAERWFNLDAVVTRPPYALLGSVIGA